MPGLDKQDTIDRAVEVLKENDRGTYTVPTKGLYPFQWNWDSCFTALGQGHYDEARAWTEIETLFAHQWPDGMVPHIVFHVANDGYFPGPDVWRTGRPVETSGITQPAVAGFAVKRLYDRAADRERAAERARALLPKIDAWHRWFYDSRDPRREGLVAIIHPWESGRDNSIDWDEAFERVPDPRRRALCAPRHPARRPRASADQGAVRPLPLAGAAFPRPRLGQCQAARRLAVPDRRSRLQRHPDPRLRRPRRPRATRSASRRSRRRTARAPRRASPRWSDCGASEHGSISASTASPAGSIDSASIGGLMPVFAPIPQARARAVARTIERLAQGDRYLVPSHDPADPRFDSQALLARPRLARRQLHDRRRPGAAPARRRSPTGSPSPA